MPIDVGTTQSKLLALAMLLIVLLSATPLLIFPSSRCAWAQGWLGGLIGVVAKVVWGLMAVYCFCVSFLVFWPQ